MTSHSLLGVQTDMNKLGYDLIVQLWSSKYVDFTFKSSLFFSRVLSDSTFQFVGSSVCRFVGPLVCHTFFFVFFCLRPHCSCPNDDVTSNTALAHPYATQRSRVSGLVHEASVREERTRWLTRKRTNERKKKNKKKTKIH